MSNAKSEAQASCLTYLTISGLVQIVAGLAMSGYAVHPIHPVDSALLMLHGFMQIVCTWGSTD